MKVWSCPKCGQSEFPPKAYVCPACNIHLTVNYDIDYMQEAKLKPFVKINEKKYRQDLAELLD